MDGRSMPGEKEFGLVIAFLLPGFLCLWGLSYSVPEIASALDLSEQSPAPTVGGFLYVTLASLAVGLIVSAVRWFVIDRIHSLTGLHAPPFNFNALKNEDTYNAFMLIVENHYRYYQYYANILVSLLIAFFSYAYSHKCIVPIELWIVFIVLSTILYIGSRDALGKYYSRGAEILRAEREGGAEE